MPRFVLLILLILPVPAKAQELSPAEAVKRMRLGEGFRVRVVANEPDIRQPLSMTFDERGRLWVLQYLQYPKPAGLKAVSVDKYLRTVWDRVPEPPPEGPRGIDQITVLSGMDESGRYTEARTHIGGLNLASGFTIGHGGVWVAQPPYLLFYPYGEAEPEVRLTGFGMQDSHAFANSLQWGPDGWLYGAHGSTTSASIRNPARPDDPAVEFEQGVWRYHPETREFELFAEGGGNTWGLDFDKYGRMIAGTNYGGKVALHHVQGSYHAKNFGKHGPLHNPHTYGYFDHIPHEGFKGGHVTNGGIVYQADAYPEKFRDAYVAGNLLSNDLYWHFFEENGSTFTSRQGPDCLNSGDPWFRPVDCTLGPDGCVYVADWHDKRASHLDPIDNWDRTNGRIYRLEYEKSAKRFPKFDLSEESSDELVSLLEHPNKWFRKTARRLLGERKDESIYPRLVKQIRGGRDLLTLESLWALHVSGGLSDSLGLEFLGHPNEHVRSWVVRLLGDRHRVTREQGEGVFRMSDSDPSVVVRCQLACTAKRLPAEECLGIVRRLLKREGDADDPYIPLLLWWALESKTISDKNQVLKSFEGPEMWAPHISERIGRRYMSADDHDSCARLLSLSPDRGATNALVRGMSEALVGRRLASVPDPLQEPLRLLRKESPQDLDVLTFAVRLGSDAAYRETLSRVTDPGPGRTRLIDLVGKAGKGECVDVFLELLGDPKSAALRPALLAALQGYDRPRIAETVVKLYPMFSSSVRAKARSLLAARPASARLMLESGLEGVTLAEAQALSRFDDERLRSVLEERWGKLRPETPGEKLARIRWLNVLGRGAGDPAKGKALFTKNCATCHKLFGEGETIGPDLTTADRKNRMQLLTHVIDPSAYVRPEYMSFTVATIDGRLLTGLVKEQTPTAVTLTDAKGMATVIARSDIDEMRASAVSLMPEKLLGEFDDQMVRDLFAYLQRE